MAKGRADLGRGVSLALRTPPPAQARRRLAALSHPRRQVEDDFPAAAEMVLARRFARGLVPPLVSAQPVHEFGFNRCFQVWRSAASSRRKASTAPTRRCRWVSSVSPSFEKIALTYFSTADSERWRAAPMAALVLPWAISRRTSTSRLLSSCRGDARRRPLRL